MIFFGSSKFVIPILEALKEDFEFSLVITTEKNPTDAIPSFCIKNKIPYRSVSNLSDPTLNSQLSTLNSEVAILADFGLIIPREILNVFPKGIINIHPSFLPKYRGPTPVQTAVLNGEKAIGVSIIKLDDKIDHGPILSQVKEPILDNDTSESLYERLFRLSSSSIVSTIELYLQGKIILHEQDHKKATFTKHLTKQDGFINLAHPLSSEVLDRMIRAYHPWPGVWTKTKINGKEKIIKFLPDKKIQAEGKRPMSYKDFINGYPKIGKEILTKLGIF